MIDTIKLACSVLALPTVNQLQMLGWVPKYDPNTGLPKWSFKEYGSGKPYISIYKSPIGTYFLFVNVSLPAFAHGTNAKLLTEEEVNVELENLSDYVTSNSGIVFDARAAKVWNVHFTKDIFVGEDSIRPIVARLATISIPRFEPGRYGETTCYHHSKGNGKEKKKPRTIVGYGKHADAIAKGFPQSDIESSEGILRIEYRYRDKRAVNNLCQNLKIPNCALSLFTQEIADMVLQPIEKQILHLNEENDVKTRIYNLIEAFGIRHARTLVTFLQLRNVFGANFYKIEKLGFSKSHYFKCEKECRAVGIWSLSEDSRTPAHIDLLL